MIYFGEKNTKIINTMLQEIKKKTINMFAISFVRICDESLYCFLQNTSNWNNE